MKRSLFALFAASISCSEVQAPTDGNGGAVTAFVGVNVGPMDSERVVEGQTVRVEHGHISAFGPVDDVEIPDGATQIDGAGKYLMPGLAEMHGHLPSPDMPEAVTENVLFLYVANGVTTVRGMQGNPSQIPLRERIDRGELLGPRLVLGSPSMSGGNVATVEDAKRLVREYKDQGFDLLKVHETLSAEVYDAIAATAGEIGIPFGGHVTDTVGLFHALEAGQTTIDHLDNYVEALVPEGQAPREAPG
ncbi:MAG: amidohydrolase family protein, partial [Vicinamibacteria bacterium]